MVEWADRKVTGGSGVGKRMLEGIGVDRTRDAGGCRCCAAEAGAGAGDQKPGSGSNCGVSQTSCRRGTMEVVLFLLSVVVGKPVAADGVDGAVKSSNHFSHHRRTPKLR